MTETIGAHDDVGYVLGTTTPAAWRQSSFSFTFGWSGICTRLPTLNAYGSAPSRSAILTGSVLRHPISPNASSNSSTLKVRPMRLATLRRRRLLTCTLTTTMRKWNDCPLTPVCAPSFPLHTSGPPTPSSVVVIGFNFGLGPIAL